MPTASAAPSPAQLLPGTWRVGATNFPLWLRGDRLNPTFQYELRRERPLVLRDVVSWTTPEGVQKSLVGTDRQRGDQLVWRGRGIYSVFVSRWSISGVSDDGSIVGIRFAKSIATPAGVDVIVRAGAHAHSLRASVSASAGLLGLAHEEFASLTWLNLE